MAAACVVTSAILEELTLPATRLWNVVLPLGVSIATYFLAARLLGLTEVFVLLSRRTEAGRSGSDYDEDTL
jgi:hypothetical protein